jgi:O-antigen/teichoic acid export membrane protein
VEERSVKERPVPRLPCPVESGRNAILHIMAVDPPQTDAVKSIPTNPRRGERFVFSLLWNWVGVAAGLFTGLLLSPYLIRKLGTEAYGLWTLSFAVVEYGTFLDLGFRSAIVKYVAHHHTLSDALGMNRVINTGVAYAGLVSTALFVVTLWLSGYLHYFFKISPAFQDTFRLLIVLVSMSWCFSFVFGLFGACLEAIQRFDLYNKAGVISTVLRASGIAVLLYRGHGLIGIGVWTVCTQALSYILFLILFKRTVVSFTLHPRFASLETLRMMASFGLHTFVVNISNVFLNQGPPMLIGHFFTANFVAFYQLPMKLIQYTSEAVGRIGIITNTNAAEVHARGDFPVLAQLAVYSNRYSLTLFTPLALVFFIFGDRILKLWVPSIAEKSAPLLPILLAGYIIAVVAQFGSGMLLQGMGRHQRFARGLLVEAVAVLVSLVYVLPRYGILGVAWVTCVCMVLNRGIFAPWLVTRELGISYPQFMHSIYTWPVASAAPVAALAYLLRRTILPGYTWLQLFTAGGIVATAYFGLAFFLCLPANHRTQMAGLVLRAFRIRAPQTPP